MRLRHQGGNDIGDALLRSFSDTVRLLDRGIVDFHVIPRRENGVGERLLP